VGSTAFVVILGISTVFVGLIIIILLCKLMSFFVKVTERAPQEPIQSKINSSPNPVSPAAPIQDKGALIAAVSAVVAEELGTSVSNIRIHSIKRV